MSEHIELGIGESARQGDYFFTKVADCPVGKSVKRENGRIIVGRGEKTNHHHVVALPQVKMIETTDMRRYLVSEKQFEVTHEEHAAVVLPVGVYEVVQQRQYQRREIQRVSD